jgi:3-polyprenyl-4-hydroxybenzoate decarboxylase
MSLCGRRIAFDATPKQGGPGSADEHNGLPVRDWPPIIRMSETVTRNTSARWHELGLDDSRA